MEVFGGIEAGGTKFVCAVGSGPDDLKVISFPTSSPETTINKAARFFQETAGSNLAAIGIGSFGPIDIDRTSRTYGYVTSTPKHDWRNYDFAGSISRILRVPVAFDTEVNAAALGEGRWGAAQGIDDFIYLTVGTGIGGGVIAGGKLIHGLMHPELGHIRVPHDIARDPFPGVCPFHNDCLEGLASGPAIQSRWGMAGHDLPDDHPAWALALATWVCTLSPRRIILGGGVMQREFLFSLIRSQFRQLLNGYICNRALTDEVNEYVVAPKLGSYSGVLGALLLARNALAERHS